MKVKSFGVKLWTYFAFLMAIMFVILWLLQTVFLQNFYNSMAVKNVEKAANKILNEEENTNIFDYIDTLAYNNSLLIFLTDENGKVIYNTDEHFNLYKEHSKNSSNNQSNNAYFKEGRLKNWQIGASRNLPRDFSSFLDKLSESEDKTIGYKTENGSSYIYGMFLSENWAKSNNVGENTVVLYISSSLEAIGGTVGIIRMQLIWTTIISLIISMIIAFFASHRFSKPVEILSNESKKMAKGDFDCEFKKGFCKELDALADTLNYTAEELRKTDEFRLDFLANISHDLRTPLTMIKGYAESIYDFSWENKKECEEDLAVIIKETDRLTALVNDILEYSSLHFEKNHTEYEKFNISNLTESIITQFSKLCNNKECEIKSYIDENVFVYGNKKQIERVLYNLIDNALTHSGNIKKIDITLNKTNDEAVIKIRDYGKGIPKEELAHIWDKYFTMKQQKRNALGSGLGLAISKEILLSHKAIFGVESEEGKGCEFWFKLKNMQ
ncbi:MAG: ATP-binding protein [Lachnospirales bacterium]